MANAHHITRRAALSAACATAAAGAVAAPALAEIAPTAVQALYPAYRRAYLDMLDMLDTQEVHTIAERSRIDLEEADEAYVAALSRWHDAEIAVLEARATCRTDALLQIEVMRDCFYHKVPESDAECVRAFTVAENLAALLA